MNKERKNVLWLMIFRLIIVTSVIISAVIIQYSTSIFLPLRSFYHIILAFYALSVVYFLLFQWNKKYVFQTYLQILLDLVLITALVYLSGGIKGSFYFLYIFEVIAASIIISQRGAYLIAALSAIFFGLLVDGMYYGIIPYFSPEMSYGISLGSVVNTIFIAWGVFFLVAFLVNYLTGRLRKTEDELLTAHKELETKKNLAIAGEISAQLAHEIRNPLAAISGSIQVLSKELKLKGKQKNLMNIVVDESDRVSQSISQFLTLASPGKQTYSWVNLNGILSEILVLLKRSGELDSKFRIEGNHESEKITYFGNANQFKQVFWNIIKNSLKAMPEGGTLTIDFANSSRNHLQLRFADTGIGMTEEERERVFDPFYSSFEKGNGIGMALVYRIIDEYNGKIRISSQQSQGTEVIISLPHRKKGRKEININ